MSNPAASFEPYRRRLLGLAYRMLGSIADAEDAVQETYLRWHAADRDKVLDARAFLMTTTTRICLDMLTSARARREEYVGPWLPEPVVDTAALAPDSRTELAEDLSIALLLTLDRLSPLERAAFLLHDVFDFSFSEVASALERSEAACRQLGARARAHVRAARPRGGTAPPARSSEIDAKHAQLISLGPQYEGNMFVGPARDFVDGGQLFMFKLNGDRSKLVLEGHGRQDGVADNFFKFDMTESEDLIFGTGFGVVTDIRTGPNGNLFLVSLTHGAIYEIVSSK
jgi:RNA polymerase sigma factor (sigma-70 family)